MAGNSVLKQQIQDDMKTAMRAHDSARLGTIRLLLAAIKQREIDERISLQEPQLLAVIEKMIKQRRDSATQFQAASRKDLCDKENAEIVVLQHYLPSPLTEAEVEEFIKKAMQITGAVSMQDMGKVMGILKPQLQGRADIGQVSAKIKALLTNK
ncbi:MAG: GatB/YqeY domain-containing protein [Gammaproteobacteria bacterium]|nr:GatB/YqeY domain-containing protein [Gammaproteobacteria bacterium]